MKVILPTAAIDGSSLPSLFYWRSLRSLKVFKEERSGITSTGFSLRLDIASCHQVSSVKALKA